ncbi:MAG: hypothetical protein PWR03_1448 [Tenuifilum sp.]|jgi:hypothetical protein|uniref:hypothetical protein n=1 Tax=Tenuifilum sp. TaxID=2760880 RepID=UPI0024AA9E0D|nr:hypothetical protein [Tenuifilum sp.]MDI3527265.1 hypothetical protein [Tenuifilum sp.]
MFKEGEWYNFTVEKFIQLPNSNSYLLVHESGKRLLLPAEYYVKYNIVVGAQIRCRVDKINCTGQIFLEPEHPFYEIGKSYNFEIVEEQSTPIKGITNVVVRDVFSNNLTLLVPSKSFDSRLTASSVFTVVNIKKGLPILSFPASKHQCKHKAADSKMVEMTLVGTMLIQGEEYYVLQTETECFSLLKVKHYKHYNLVKNEVVRATFRGYSDNGFLKVDPVHPYYQLGKTYDFIVKGVENGLNFDEGYNKSIAVVYDKFGMKCGVKIDNAVAIGENIKCRVVGYRKGRPQLEVVPKEQKDNSF